MASRKTTTDQSNGLAVLVLFATSAIIVLSFLDLAGVLGAWIDRFLGWILGSIRYLLPIALGGFGMILLSEKNLTNKQWAGLIIFSLSVTALLYTTTPAADLTSVAVTGTGGGLIGLILGYPLIVFTGPWVTSIVTGALTITGVLLLFELSVQTVWQKIELIWEMIVDQWETFANWRANRRLQAAQEELDEADQEGEIDETLQDADEESFQAQVLADDEADEETDDHDGEEGVDEKEGEADQEIDQLSKASRRKRSAASYTVPVDLLIDRSEKPTSGDIELNKIKIKRTLESFKIPVEMGAVSIGPMVTQYTLKPSEGVKLNQITSLHNDIALALAAHPIRIEAPIPGKSLVGIEIPNKMAATVTIKELLQSKMFATRKDNLALCLGKDVSGSAALQSLSRMPHLLIAGATGSGKSVCINGIILSLLYQNSPNDLRFIMVDPKRVELSVYNGIPHLLTPVITEPEKTINALKWAVMEMDRRYDVLSAAGKRNIDSYNESVDPEERLPMIVFIIDELADLMSVAASSVEGAIVRLAQMARAIGIHLILATQRPSVNVITGLIKANMPARIAFSVTSIVDSRTILDFSGAEKLLGRGDMLYIDSQRSKPARYQGAFVSDQEIESVVEFLRTQDSPGYNADIVDTITQTQKASGGLDETDDHNDPLIPEAKEVILQAGKASASLLQRRLRVGYARAARLLDILEQQGFIGPGDGAKPREILGQADDVDESEQEQSAEDQSDEESS